MKLAGLILGGLVAAAPAMAQIDKYDTPKPMFSVQPAKTLPQGEQTRKGGFGAKNVILWQRYAADAWAAIEAPVSIEADGWGNRLDLPAGTVLTGYRSSNGETTYCYLKTERMQSAETGPFSHYLQVKSGEITACLIDSNNDGTFEFSEPGARNTDQPHEFWQLSMRGKRQTLRQPVAYRKGTDDERPYGSFNIFLTAIPFQKGYYIATQEVMLGGLDLTNGGSSAFIPAEPDGPASLTLGKLRIDVKSHRGAFVYEVVSAFDGETYPGFGTLQP